MFGITINVGKGRTSPFTRYGNADVTCPSAADDSRADPDPSLASTDAAAELQTAAATSQSPPDLICCCQYFIHWVTFLFNCEVPQVSSIYFLKNEFI